MPSLVVKQFETIGIFFEDDLNMKLGENVFWGGIDYVVVEVKHFIDAGKGVNEYKKINSDVRYFTRYTIKS